MKPYQNGMKPYQNGMKQHVTIPFRYEIIPNRYETACKYTGLVFGIQIKYRNYCYNSCKIILKIIYNIISILYKKQSINILFIFLTYCFIFVLHVKLTYIKIII